VQNSWEERMVAYLEHQIRSDPSLTYGEGFRAAFESYQKVGLPSLICHVQQTGRLPDTHMSFGVL